MKKLYFPNIKVELSALIFIIFGLFFNCFNYLFLFYLLALIHELAHVLMAIIFKVEVEEISFNALGFNAKIKDLEFVSFKKQVLILLAGPLSFIPSYFLITYLYEINFISIYALKVALDDNISLLIFNLIPFYPLDGGRILELILYKFNPAYKAKKIKVFISCIVSIFLISLCIEDYQYLLLLFIVYYALTSIIFLKREYHDYLISRVGKISFFKKKKTPYPQVYHFYHNIYEFENKQISEEDYIIKNEINLIKQKAKQK